MRFETDLVNYCPAPGDPLEPSSTPIYQTATFRQASPTECGSYDYTRSGNPTRSVLEQQVARLEGGHDAAAFASGMAAVAAVTSLLAPGNTVIACCDLYGGTHRYLTEVVGRGGVCIEFVDTSSSDVVLAACKGKPRLLWIETPTNPLQSVTDLRITAVLAQHPVVKRVHHLSLDDHPGRAIHETRATGPGSVISFETATSEQAIRVIQACRLFSTTVSFGSVCSSISLPRCMSHASIPTGAPVARFDDRLVRLSVGLEHADDMVGDLRQAMDAAATTDNDPRAG